MPDRWSCSRNRRSSARANLPPAAQVIDWIPALDARVVPAIKLALPGARLLRVARGPHDTLLNWLAFGWMRGFPLGDALVAARWLRLAHLHLDVASSQLPTLSIEADALSAEPGAPARGQVAAFLGMPALADDAAVQAAPHAQDLLPFRFAPGHARHYRESLPEAFAALDGLSHH